MEDFWTFLINAFLFYLAYKLGQVSAYFKLGTQKKEDMQLRLEEVRRTGIRPLITVEEINGIYYAFDGNDFLAQGRSPDELGISISNRFPNKYHMARIEIKTNSPS